MLKVTEELLTGIEEILKRDLQAVDVLAVWDTQKEELQLELYFPEGRYRIVRFGKIYSESNF